VLALAAVAVLILSFTSVLYGIVDVVGDPATFAGVVVATVVVATALSPVLSIRTGLAIGGALLVAGLGVYLLALPVDVIANRARILSDVFAMLTGLSVLRMTKAGVWALGFAPGPLFVSTYLFARRRYGLGVLVGGLILLRWIAAA
jgi:hypothetical protein